MTDTPSYKIFKTYIFPNLSMNESLPIMFILQKFLPLNFSQNK